MLTKRKALEETIALWSWLAENPDKDKEDATEEPELRHIAKYTHVCPCCEYTSQYHDDLLNCYECLVWGNPDLDYGCESGEGTYAGWCIADYVGNYKQKTACAKAIVAKAQAALDALDLSPSHVLSSYD